MSNHTPRDKVKRPSTITRLAWVLGLLGIGLLASIRGIVLPFMYPAGITQGICAIFGADIERNSRVFYNIFHPVLGYLIYGLLIVTISFSSTKFIRYAIGTMVVVTILNIHGCNYVLNSAMKSL